MITFQLNPAFYLRTLTFSVARYSLFSAIKKAVTCCFRIHLPRNANIAHILSLSITPCTVMGVLFSSILYLPPPHYIFSPPIIPLTLLHLPSSLSAVTINFLLVMCVHVYVCWLDFVYRCVGVSMYSTCMYRCVSTCVQVSLCVCN